MSFFFELSQIQSCTFHLQATGSSIHKAGSGLTGLGLGRGRALLTGQTGFGVWSVGFVLGAAAKVVIHLQDRISS